MTGIVPAPGGFGRIHDKTSSLASMHILISNDDGYNAPGLEALAGALGRFARVTVVAPDRNRSGASNSLTLDNPLRADEVRPGWWKVNGTPTDCVHLAITGLLKQEPDIVVSGINAGPNMGDDVIYSGTVAAATEGRFLGLPAVAVSSASWAPRHLETAAARAGKLVEVLMQAPDEHGLGMHSILNVNIPDLPEAELGGFEATRLGARHKAESVVEMVDPRGLPCYWVGAAGPEQDAGPGTDFHAVRQGRISVSPLQVDLTRHEARQPLAAWLESIP